MTRIIIAFLFIGIFYGNAQKSINDYKYVILPQKFDFLKEADQYRLNTQTRFLLKKQGFIVYYDSEKLPKDLEENVCLALNANVIKLSSVLRTKLVVELHDCHNNVIYASDEGISKEKSYNRAYVEALNNAFISFNKLDYSYMPKKLNEAKRESHDLQKKQPSRLVITNSNSMLFKATPNKNGYDLRDTNGKIIYQIIKSHRDGIFLFNNNQGVLYKNEENKWIREYIKNGVSEIQVLYIEF